MSDPIKTKRVRCKECATQTNHTILFTHEVNGDDDENHVSWWNTYQVVKCAGCDAITFVHVHANTESVDYETGKLEEYVRLYPERGEAKSQAHRREEIECAHLFPGKTRRVYREVIKSLEANLPVLSAIGIRAIIESICIDLKASGGNLQKKIDDLAVKGHLATSQAEFLHGLRFMGNSAAHEIEAAQPAEIVAALEIAETLLKTIYFLPDLSNTIKTGRPTSPAPKPTATKKAPSKQTSSKPQK